MPFELRWIPAPKDESLIVHKEKLSGPCHECRYCGGWIEGIANSYHENTLAPLAGRKGTVEYCRRCGREISFFGMRS